MSADNEAQRSESRPPGTARRCQRGLLEERGTDGRIVAHSNRPGGPAPDPLLRGRRAPLDGETLVSHFSAGPDFYIYSDGQRLTYEAMATAVRSAFPTLRSIVGGFDDVDIMVLSPDTALATATFHETVTSRDGNRAAQHGAATWLWRHVEGEWRITYGHIDHYPGEHQR